MQASAHLFGSYMVASVTVDGINVQTARHMVTGKVIRLINGEPYGEVVDHAHLLRPDDQWTGHKGREIPRA